MDTELITKYLEVNPNEAKMLERRATEYFDIDTLKARKVKLQSALSELDVKITALTAKPIIRRINA